MTEERFVTLRLLPYVAFLGWGLWVFVFWEDPSPSFQRFVSALCEGGLVMVVLVCAWLTLRRSG